jgi:Ca2+-binding EF-hand superfamily protein
MDEKRLDWIETFELWDRKKTGLLPLRDVVILIKCLGCVPTVKEISNLHDEFSSNPVNLDQFLRIMAKIYSEEQLKEDLAQAFRCLDNDENGFIPEKTLKKTLTTLGKKPFSDKEFESLISDTPPTNEGDIDIILLRRTITAKALR